MTEIPTDPRIQQVQVFSPDGTFLRGWNTGIDQLFDLDISPRTGDIFLVHSQRNINTLPANSLVQRYNVKGQRRAGWDIYRKYGDPIVLLTDILALPGATPTTDTVAVSAYCSPGYEVVNGYRQMGNGFYLKEWPDLMQFTANGSVRQAGIRTNQGYRSPSNDAHMALYFSETDEEYNAWNATLTPAFWTGYFRIRSAVLAHSDAWADVGIDYITPARYSYLDPIFLELGEGFTDDFRHKTLQPHIASFNYSHDLWQALAAIDYPEDVQDVRDIDSITRLKGIAYNATTDHLVTCNGETGNNEIFARDGERIATLPMGATHAAANSETGRLYLASGATVYQYTADGQSLNHITLYTEHGNPLNISTIKVSAFDGTIYVLGTSLEQYFYTEGWLVRLSPALADLGWMEFNETRRPVDIAVCPFTGDVYTVTNTFPAINSRQRQVRRYQRDIAATHSFAPIANWDTGINDIEWAWYMGTTRIQIHPLTGEVVIIHPRAVGDIIAPPAGKELSAPIWRGWHHLVYRDGDAILYRRMPEGGSSFGAPARITLVDTIGIEDGGCPDITPESDNRLTIVWRDAAGGIRKGESRDFGKTWSLAP